jgi:hypothetical protein
MLQFTEVSLSNKREGKYIGKGLLQLEQIFLNSMLSVMNI